MKINLVKSWVHQCNYCNDNIDIIGENKSEALKIAKYHEDNCFYNPKNNTCHFCKFQPKFTIDGIVCKDIAKLAYNTDQWGNGCKGKCSFFQSKKI